MTEDPGQDPQEVAAPSPADGQVESADTDDRLSRLTAALIMLVTLVGTVFAFWQGQAGNREVEAAREAQRQSLESLSLNQGANREIDKDSYVNEIYTDNGWLRFSYDRDEVEALLSDPEYSEALSESFGSVEGGIKKYSSSLAGDYVLEDGTTDFTRFYQELYRDSTVAAEFEKAHGAERDGWGGKSDQLVTVITILAVALFLLGLSTHVSGGIRRPFLILGCVVGLVAAAWGTMIYLRPVEKPSPEAIAAYVDGVTLLNHSDNAEEYTQARADFDEALSHRGEYVEALLARGNAAFSLDFLNPDGPQGSAPARDDFAKAIELGEDDPLAWGNYGATQFWLRDYEGSLRSTQDALRQDPRNITWNTNLTEGLITTGRDAELPAAIATIREIMGEIPGWLLEDSMQGTYEAIDLAIQYRPELADKERALKDQLMEEHHEVLVARRLFGEPVPPPIAATASDLRFDLNEDKTEMTVEFDYTGVEEGQQWFYETYIDGVKDDTFKTEPEPWSFDVPDGGIVLTFTQPDGFKTGSTVRTEVFIEGNLVSGTDFVVP